MQQMTFRYRVSKVAILAAAAASCAAASSLNAQTSLGDQKTQAEINKLESEQRAIELTALANARRDIAGSAQVTAPEATAEGMLLARILSEQAAERIAADFANWRSLPANAGRTGAVTLTFGDQPPSIAEFLAAKEAFDRLAQALGAANAAWEQATDPSVEAFFDPMTLGMIATGITTFTSLLRTNTVLAGVTVTPSEQEFRAILHERLRAAALMTDAPRTIPGEPRYVTERFRALDSALSLARRNHADYLVRLRTEGGGKPENLREDRRAAGAALSTVLADVETLRRALYSPVEGVLPATRIDEQARLYEERDTRPVIYVYNHEAAITTTTRQGLLTGIRGIPAYVSAASVVDYGFAGNEGRRGRVVSSTPVMRSSHVRDWATQMQDSQALPALAGEDRARDAAP